MKNEKITELLTSFIQKGDRILDVGCGNCDLLKRIADEIEVKAVGVDPAKPTVKDKIDYRRLPAEEIDRLDLDFELIFTVHSLHHFNDAKEFLANARKDLAPEGKLVIIDWQHGAETGTGERYFKESEIGKLLKKSGLCPSERKIQGDTQIIISNLKNGD